MRGMHDNDGEWVPITVSEETRLRVLEEKMGIQLPRRSSPSFDFTRLRLSLPYK